MPIPIAIITDPDVEFFVKEGEDYVKKDENLIKTETKNKISELNAKNVQKIKYFPAPEWTLEYSLLKSKILREKFKGILTSVHPRSSWDTDYEKELAKKLINNGLKKTSIACELAHIIDTKLLGSISPNKIQEDEYIQYLLNAIRYVAGEDNDNNG